MARPGLRSCHAEGRTVTVLSPPQGSNGYRHVLQAHARLPVQLLRYHPLDTLDSSIGWPVVRPYARKRRGKLSGRHEDLCFRKRRANRPSTRRSHFVTQRPGFDHPAGTGQKPGYGKAPDTPQMQSVGDAQRTGGRETIQKNGGKSGRVRSSSPGQPTNSLRKYRASDIANIPASECRTSTRSCNSKNTHHLLVLIDLDLA